MLSLISITHPVFSYLLHLLSFYLTSFLKGVRNYYYIARYLPKIRKRVGSGNGLVGHSLLIHQLFILGPCVLMNSVSMHLPSNLIRQMISIINSQARGNQSHDCKSDNSIPYVPVRPSLAFFTARRLEWRLT